MALLWECDQYDVHELLIPLVGRKYEFRNNKNYPIAYAHKPALRLKNDIYLYNDKAQNDCILELNAMRIMDEWSKYELVDPYEECLVGTLTRKAMKSIVRPCWEVNDAFDEHLGDLLDDFGGKALMKKAWDNRKKFISNFENPLFLLHIENEVPVTFEFTKTRTWSVNIPPSSTVDRKIIAALAILIIAIEDHLDID